MLRRFLVLVVLTMFSSTISEGVPGVRKASHSQAGVSWLFNIRNDKYGNPRGTVFLIVGGRKVLILPKAASQYRLLKQTEYESHGVPAIAITACTGWWAGRGEDLYVIRRKKQLQVFIRYLDEGAETTAYKLLKVIPQP